MNPPKNKIGVLHNPTAIVEYFEYVLVSLDKAAALWYTPDHE